jgi:polyferredoxin
MTAAPTDKPVPPDPLAFLPRQDRHKPKCGPVRPSKMSRRRMWVLVAVHVLIGLHIVHWLWTGRTLTPVEPSEATKTLQEGHINAGFVLFLVLIAGTLVFGRFFCGWGCHLVALQDLAAHWLGKLGWKPRPLRSRLLVLAPWVVAFHMFAWPTVHRLWFAEVPQPGPEWQWHLSTDELWATFPGPLMTVLTVLVAAFLIVWWLGAKGFCTHGCPYGAFFAIADRFAPVRIKVTDACNACGHCTQVCTSNVRVHEEVARHGKLVDPGCMKCLDCVSVCPKDALYVGLALPKPFAVSQQRIQARSDFTWFEEVVVGALAFGAAEFTFRGAWFGEGVPLLLSVALGVLTAVMALLWWRLWWRPDVQFQNTVLKSSGRRNRNGNIVLLAVTMWLAFAAHTCVAQRFKADVIAQVLAVSGFGATPAQLQDALAAAERAHGWDLVDDPMVGEMRGLLLRRLERHAEAEQMLSATYLRQGHMQIAEASLVLAMYCMDPARRRFELAESLLLSVIKSQPNHPAARKMLESLQQMRR